MKRLIYISLIVCTFIFTGCEKDNYEAPQNVLTGHVVYQDQAVGLKQTRMGQDNNMLELYQPGFEGTSAIPVYIDQEGKFSALVYNGTYKLKAKKNSGPWVDIDTELNFDVRGDTQIDFPVTPYYTIRNVHFNVESNNLEASFRIDRGAFSLIDGKPGALIESIALYIGNTRFVDDATNCKRIDTEGLDVGTYTINVNLESADLKKYPVLYARIGVGTKGISQKVYTPGSERIK